MDARPLGSLWVCLLLGTLAAGGARAQPRDPHLRFHTVETRHFSVHYYEPLGRVARRVARVAERAHTVVTRAVGHRPRERTHIVLTDEAEGSNGSATVLPRNVIRLFVTAPDDLSSLADYDDWLKVLVTHEHTHVVHLDQISGLPAVINAIFGKVYAPNNIQPRWFIEGLATFEESEHTGGGRLRSSLFEMYVRMATLEGSLFRIDQLSNDPDRFPRGDAFYLYGSRFVSFIAERYGRSALRKMSRDYGRQAVPYGMNRIAHRATGKTFVALYDDFCAYLRAHHGSVAERLNSEGRVEGKRITFHGESAQVPRFLDAHTLAYWVSDGRSASQIRLVDLADGRAETIVRVAGVSGAAPAPESSRVYYASLDSHRDIYFLYDLFVHDRKTGTTERLTHGLRAKDPDVSPDGRSLAFTVNGAGTRHLMIGPVDRVDQEHRVLVRSRRFEQIYSPRFSPDGEKVAFSTWRRGGYRDISLVDVHTGEVEHITHDRALDASPVWSPDGRRLYFSSDRTGIFNIYAWDTETRTLSQVTHVLGGAFQPAVSADGSTLVYVGYHAKGFDLYALPLDPAKFRDARPYVDPRPLPADPDQAEMVLRSEPYRAARTVLPRAYSVDLSSGPFGQELGVEFDGSDVVGFHRYHGRVAVPFDHADPSASLDYVYLRFPTPLSLRLFRRVAPRGGLVVGGEPRRWLENALGGEVGVSYRLFRSFYSETLRASYALTHIRKGAPFGGELDPNDPPPSLPDTGLIASLRLGWAFSNVERHTWDISASKGITFGVNITLADPLLGSDFHSVSLSWSGATYIENPFLEHHVLAIRYGGGISQGDLGRRGVFAVGGFPEVPVRDAILEDRFVGGVALRGYPPFARSGSQFHLLQTEYRLPLMRPRVGLYTLPVYLTRMYMIAFVDYGDAFFDDFDLSTFRAGAGGELLSDVVVGYFLHMTLRLGFAWGFHRGGGAQTYFNAGFPF